MQIKLGVGISKTSSIITIMEPNWSESGTIVKVNSLQIELSCRKVGGSRSGVCV